LGLFALTGSSGCPVDLGLFALTGFLLDG